MNISLFEFVASAPNRVDTEAGIIYGVKVLGIESGNTGRALGLDPAKFGEAVDLPYVYPIETMRKAAPKYEGIGIYIDHPDLVFDPKRGRQPSRDRKTVERFGRLVNVRVLESGIFADLEYLKAHPLANLVVEAAQRMPEQFALSHNASGKPVLRDGRIVIEEIFDVKSVDLVGEKGGTTKSLFESNPMEDNAVITPVAEAPTPNVDEAFKQAVLAILDDGTLDKAGKVNAIRKVLDAQEKVAEAMTPAEQPAEETPAEETPAETTESLKAEVVKLKAENEALKLLESAGIKSTAILVESLVALDSTDKRKALIASWPKQQAVKKPHSTPANLVESKTRYEDLDTVAALLLSR